MSDCDIDVETEGTDEYEVVVGNGSPVVAVVSVPSAVVAVQASMPAASVVASPLASVTATVSPLAPVSAETPDAQPHEVESDVPELTQDDRQKLDSLEPPQEPNWRPLWGDGQKGFDGAFNSIPWIGSTTPLEIGRATILFPEFNRRGYLDIDISGVFVNAGAPFTASFFIEVQDHPAPVYPEVWTVVHTVTTPALGGAAGTGEFTLTMRLRAAGHDASGRWKQFSAQLLHTDLATGNVIPTPFLKRFTLDTMKDVEMRVSFQTDAAIALPQACNVTSSNAGIFNREVGDAL